MNLPSEDFEDLRKLLALKKHETPPPGYFNHLSLKVISRLERAELDEHSGWRGWLLSKFDARPVLACMYGCVVSSLLLAGFRLSQVFEAEASQAPGMPGAWLAASPDPLGFQSNNFSPLHTMSAATLTTFSSLNPVIESARSEGAWSSKGFRPQNASFSLVGY